MAVTFFPSPDVTIAFPTWYSNPIDGVILVDSFGTLSQQSYLKELVNYISKRTQKVYVAMMAIGMTMHTAGDLIDLLLPKAPRLLVVLMGNDVDWRRSSFTSAIIRVCFAAL